MEYIGCYDSVMEIVDEGAKEFAATHTPNEEKKAVLGDVCEAVDNFVGEIDCNFVDVSVNSNSKQLTIDIGCDDIILHGGRDSQFFTLIQMVDSFSFSKTKNGGLCIALNVDNVWERLRG